MIACYAIALQALLSAFAIVPPVALADPALAICQPGGADPASQHQQNPCATCLAGHCAGAAAAAQRIVAAEPWPAVHVEAQAPFRSAAPPSARIERQNSPRAPPLG